MLLLDQNWGLALVSGAITVSVAAMLDATMMELPCPNTAQYNGIVDEIEKNLLNLYSRAIDFFGVV